MSVVACRSLLYRPLQPSPRYGVPVSPCRHGFSGAMRQHVGEFDAWSAEHCSQIPKIGAKPNLTEKIITFCKALTKSTQQFCLFQITDQVTKLVFWVYMQKQQKLVIRTPEIIRNIQLYR